MIKEAGLENSGIMDSGSGKAVFVSSTARIFFRKAYPGYKRIRNNVMNQYIAKMFSSGKPAGYFRPKGSKGGGSRSDVGVIREVSGGKFIGIISPNHVRIIAIKGSPSGLPGLPQTPIQMGDQKNPGYRGDVPGSESGGVMVPGPVNTSFPAQAPAGGSGAIQTALQGAT